MARSDDESGPHLVDVHVGQVVTTLRNSRGVNQAQLAAALGLTFQQIQKYEKGANRMSASKLWQAAQFLGVDLNRLFDGLETGDGPSAAPDRSTIVRSTPYSREIETLAKRLTPQQQKLALALVRAMVVKATEVSA